MTTLRFTAMVNDSERWVDLDSSLVPDWALAWMDGTTQNGEPDNDDLDAFETVVMNTESLYREFYAGADDDELAAELDNLAVTVIDAPTCEWFALCDNEAVYQIAHPVLGWVPTCQRCADRFDLVERS